MLGIFGLMERLSANHIDMRVFFSFFSFGFKLKRLRTP